MDSMSDAMRAALEHPIEEPPQKPTVAWKPRTNIKETASAGSGYFWLGLAGSVGATLLFLRQRKKRSERRALPAAFAELEFGGD